MAAGNLRPLGDVESVTATDDDTVEFKFKKALGGRDLEGILGECPIVSQKAYEASADKFATKPISTSAYVVTESVPGSTITFEKNADYWQTDAAAAVAVRQAERRQDHLPGHQRNGSAFGRLGDRRCRHLRGRRRHRCQVASRATRSIIVTEGPGQPDSGA